MVGGIGLMTDNADEFKRAMQKIFSLMGKGALGVSTSALG